MCQCIELFFSCTLIWLYFEAILFMLLDFFRLSVPWLVYATFITALGIRFGFKLPLPDDKAVKKVLGADPLVLANEEEREITSPADGEEQVAQYCIRVIAHRGAGYDFPENSMSAFRNSFHKGCDAIEFDLALTKDNVPIIFHDNTIDRLTGKFGTIREMTWNELQNYDISTTHPLRVKFDEEGERIALFDDVIKECLENETRMFIDIKATGNEIVKVVVEAFKKYPIMYERAVVTSLNPVVVYQIRQKDPCIVGGMAWRPQIFSMIKFSGTKGAYESRFENLFVHILAMMVDAAHDWAISRLTYYVLGLSFIILHKDIVSPDLIRQWNKRGLRVYAYSVNLPSEKVHFLKNLKVSFLTDTLLS